MLTGLQIWIKARFSAVQCLGFERLSNLIFAVVVRLENCIEFLMQIQIDFLLLVKSLARCGIVICEQLMLPCTNILGMVADTESSDSLPGSSNAASEMPANGSIHRKSQEKPPKKTHKAEREKLKRDQLNDLFVELGSMLDLDRQNTGKATVLGDAARVLRDLITQVESLRQEQSALVSERQY
ncbi:hypothetical protein ACJX0J_019224, partial [Zea mays]